MSLHPVASLVLASARSMLGEMEYPAYSNHHPTVNWYNANVENLGAAWNYCNAGTTREYWATAAKPFINGRAYVPWCMGDFEDGFKGAKIMWVDNDVSMAQPADFVFFDWSKPVNGRRSRWTGDHVGIVESIKDRDTVITLEHNTLVPGKSNEGVARKVRDAKYIVAFGRIDWSAVPIPYIPGTSLLPLTVDGSAGPKLAFAWGTVMKARGFAVTPSTSYRPDLIKAVQLDLRQKNIRDRNGRQIVVDGVGIGSNQTGRFPREGWYRTISALQIGHGVKRLASDGVFDAFDSPEVSRIQRDININGVNDSPNYND